jgi:hypothetical protein
MPPRDRWTIDEARAWYAAQPWLVGCNFIPSNAVNQLEMWQAQTFDIETIDRELGWAADIGFNSVRVFLHNLLWQRDAKGLLGRVDQFLGISERHSISTMLVLFDGVWDPHPRIGPQRTPRPRVHNAGWVQSPGADILGDPSRQAELEGYVSGVVENFCDDVRVLAWDLFNEPDNRNPAYAARELDDKAERATELLIKIYPWSRAAGPSQPITVGIYGPEWGDLNKASGIDRLVLTESDVISFHSYQPPDGLRKRIDALERYGRPILLTEYMARGAGSTFEGALPLLKERHVGAYNWGFVSGKTQTIYPWDSWAKKYESEPDLWFHDVLRSDGTPYREEEVALIRRLTRY